MSTRHGPPKHQNKIAWKPHAGNQKNETEVGGKLRPYSEITGVCARCKDQIDWKRRYGKYKPLIEPAKCQKCSKRNVRQAYHNLCTNCANENGVCAKCCCKTDRVIGRDIAEIEAERKTVEEALRHARERDRRTLLRAMSKESAGSKSSENPKIADRSREGELFPEKSIDEYAAYANDCDLDDEDNSLTLK